MERLNFVKNGVRRLPPGFRFQPTDEEIVFQYLKSKIFSSPLPASIIPTVNLSNFDPWDLPGNCEEEERYFFSYKEAKYRNGNRMNRTTKSGYWKATGSDKKIISSSSSNIDNNKNNNVGGIRKTLVFYQGKPPHGRRTNWVMHQYRLILIPNSSTHLQEVGDWVVCRICLKGTRGGGGDVENRSSSSSSSNDVAMNADVAEPRFFDFMRIHNNYNNVNVNNGQQHYSYTSSSCSSSSAITEDCSEETSGYNNNNNNNNNNMYL